MRSGAATGRGRPPPPMHMLQALRRLPGSSWRSVLAPDTANALPAPENFADRCRHESTSCSDGITKPPSSLRVLGEAECEAIHQQAPRLLVDCFGLLRRSRNDDVDGSI